MRQILRLSIDELQYVQYVAYQTWPSTFKDILTLEQIQYMLEWMYNLDTLKQQFDKGQHFYAVLEKDRYIGFTAIEFHHPEKEIVKIHKLYVLPEFHAKGVGKALVDQVRTAAKEEKMRAIVLNVNRFNPAVSFYEKDGFKIIKEEVIDIGNGYVMDDYVMEMLVNG